jgi:riboflavin kinase/FMN adenylyltransferase
MKTFRTLESVQSFEGKVFVAIGVFDGVHLGHQAIINRMIQESPQYGARSMVFTFLNHPLSMLAPPYAPERIMTPAQQQCFFRHCGIDILLRPRFSQYLARMSPQEFITDLLLKKLKASRIYCGEDFQFGKDGTGKVAYLKTFGKRKGIETIIVPPVMSKGSRVSSTMIRELIHAGRITEANSMLGHPLELIGTVIKGRGIGGTELGFPTANLRIHRELIVPAKGVYAVEVTSEGACYNGIMNIGRCPTFGKLKQSLEVHLIDFTGDLLGKKISVTFFKRLREELKFDSPGELKSQIARDKQNALDALKVEKKPIF